MAKMQPSMRPVIREAYRLTLTHRGWRPGDEFSVDEREVKRQWSQVQVSTLILAFQIDHPTLDLYFEDIAAVINELGRIYPIHA